MSENVLRMRTSRVLAKLRRGEVALSSKSNLACARVAEIAGMFGFDCFWADMEHTGNDISVVENQIRASKAYDMDVLVRVMRGGYNDYIRPLELDAAGIMVPHLMSAEDARQVARMTRFQPIGRRPVDGGNADGAYCNIPIADYARQANEQRFVIVQIEDHEPLAELDKIAKVEGIDMLFFGPGDFSHSINALGDMDNPEIDRARRMVAEAALAHGKFAGTVAAPAGAQRLIEMGYRKRF